MTVTRTLEWQVTWPCSRRQLVTSVRLADDTAVLQAQAALQPQLQGSPVLPVPQFSLQSVGLSNRATLS